MAYTRFHKVVNIDFGYLGSSQMATGQTPNTASTSMKINNEDITANHVCLNTTAISDFDFAWETGDGWAKISVNEAYFDKAFPGGILSFAAPIETI